MRTPKFIISTPEPKDGVAKYAAELAAALAQTGIETVLFCPSNFEFKAIAELGGAKIACAPDRDVASASLARRIFRNLAFMVKAAAAQLRLTSRGDVVHFQNPLHFPLGFVFYALVWLKRGTVVLTVHDPLPHRWRFPGSLARIERAMLGWAYRLPNAVVVHNVPGREILTTSFGVAANRVHIIPHGPDNGSFVGSIYPDFSQLRLLAFGAIRRNKGLHLAIAGVQALKNALSVPVSLTIRGELYTAAESGYWNECKAMIAADSAAIDAELGFVPDHEIAELLAGHHALILPYGEFYSESGVAALALSHRRPLLATNAGGLAEMFDQFHCGILIGEFTQGAVEEAIRTAVDAGAGRLEQMGIAGEYALRNLRSWESIGRRTAQLYCDLLQIEHSSLVGELVGTGQDH